MLLLKRSERPQGAKAGDPNRMKDYLVRSITDQSNVIGLACVSTNLAGEASLIHGTSATASAALGRALTGALLLSSLMKRGQRLALKFEGNGPLKKIIAEADSEGTARGYVGVPDVEVPPKDGKLNVSGALGKEGSLTVIKDLGLKEPYKGIVKLNTGEIAEDIAYYLAESEQVPSAVGLGVFVGAGGKVTAAGGFLVQTLFSVEDGMVDQLIQNVRKIPFVTEILREGKTPEDILDRIFVGFPHHVIQKQDLSLRCTCSRERVIRALVTLGGEELKGLISEQEKTEVTCEFCRTRYAFDRKDLEDLLQMIAPTQATA